VTYRASISTGTPAGQELVAALEEWPRVHRSILLQGKRMSVGDTCPVIIQSLNVEECEVFTISQPVMVTLSTFLAAVISIAGVLGSVTMVMMILLMCALRYKKRYKV
jgi:hypothetical protein